MQIATVGKKRIKTSDCIIVVAFNFNAGLIACKGNKGTLLDSVSGESDWAEAELRMKTFANNTAYRYYRMRLVASAGYCDLSQFEYKLQRKGIAQPCHSWRGFPGVLGEILQAFGEMRFML